MRGFFRKRSLCVGGARSFQIAGKLFKFSLVLSIVYALVFGGWFHLTVNIGPHQFTVTNEVQIAHAATAGPNYATADCTQVDYTSGTISWTNVGNASTTDDIDATSALNDSEISEYIYCSNFGFSVPDGATIDGVTLEIEQAAQNAGRVEDHSVRLATSSATVDYSTDDKQTATTYGTADAFQSYGGVADTWNEPYTSDDINSTGFGVMFAAIKSSAAGNATNALIDSMRITVTYTTEADPPTPDPMNFATSPNATTSSAVEMISTTGSDASGPVMYFFTATSSGCTAGHNGSWGSSSPAWQTGTTYYDDGLDANKCYGYLVTARDNVLNYGATSTASTTYTRAAVPGGVTYSAVGVTTLTIDNTENGNPASNPTTDFLIYATSTDANWNGFYVNASGATSSSEVWITDAQVDALSAFTGLVSGTAYDFQAVARNEDGIRTATSTLTSTTTLSDVFAPTPDPPTFSTSPGDLSTSSIDMAATTGTDDTGPIEYYFTIDNSTCFAGDEGTWGSSSAWQLSDTTYIDNGLLPNKCYGYKVTMRDSLENYGATSTASTTYTAANPALAPALSSPSDTALTLNNSENSNPASTTFLIRIASSTPNDPNKVGGYIDASGGTSTTEVWLKDSDFTNRVVTGLSFLTTYSFEAVSRNGDGDRTATSSQGDGTTLQDQTAPTPDPIFDIAPTNDSSSSISATSTTVSDPSTPVEYFFTATSSTCTAADVGAGGTDSGWQESATTTDTGLQPNQCYGYMVTARDAFGNESATSTASSTYTSANVPGVLVFTNVSSSTFDITNDENSNPTADPITTYAVYATSSDGTWNNVYVDSSGNPQGSVQWLNDGQINNLTVNGLTELTLYDFVVVARNADLDITSSSTLAGTTTIDLTGPTPDPLTFIDTAGLPDNDAGGQISMESVLATDPTGPISYYFATTTGSCGADAGTDSSDSGWQSGVKTYTDSAGISPNKCYAYTITARDADNNYNSTSTASSTYSSANVPGTPVLSSPAETTLVLDNTPNSNPSSNPTTQFIVRIASSTPNDAGKVGGYITAGGATSTSEVWLTNLQLTSLTVTGLLGNHTYSFEAVARNEDGDRTATSSQGDGSTGDDTAPTPDPMIFSTTPNNTGTSTMNMISTTGTDISTVEYFFTATSSTCTTNHNGTGGSNRTWNTSTTYNDSILQANKCYGYLLTARDTVGNTGATSTASSTYTSASVPGTPSLSSPTEFTLTITNDENSNPASNPTTEFLVYIASSTPNDATNVGKYITFPSGATQASEEWNSDATIDGDAVVGLVGSTTYSFEVVARNADGDRTATSSQGDGTTGDDSPPTPNPIFFETVPNNTGVASINMVIKEAADLSPVEYYVTATSSTCSAGHNGTGGSSSSDWQLSRTFNDSILQTNKCYGYLVTARDTVGNSGATSTASSTYTSANPAGTPVLSSPTETQLTITNNANSNPASNPTTLFAVYIASSTPNDVGKVGQYVVFPGGGSQGTPDWTQHSDLDGLVINGLSSLTTYSFEVVSRNEDGDNAATSSQGDGSTTDTSAPTPPPIFDVAPTNDSDTSISATSTASSDPSTPIEYFFTEVAGSCGADNGAGGTDSGWLSADLTYTDTVLFPNQCYAYTLTARDSLGNVTATSTASSTYTSASTPGIPSAPLSTATTIDISNDENSNPSSNPATVFAVQIVSSAPNDTNWNSQYVDTDGTPSASAVWMTDSVIEALTTTGMATDTAYTIHVKARNSDNDETSFGTSAILSTTPPPRPPIIRLNGMRLNGGRVY